jgi:hypothetical protein
MGGLPENLNGNDLAHFKYTPITKNNNNQILKEAFRARKIYLQTIVVRLICSMLYIINMKITIIYTFIELNKYKYL